MLSAESLAAGHAVVAIRCLEAFVDAEAMFRGERGFVRHALLCCHRTTMVKQVIPGDPVSAARCTVIEEEVKQVALDGIATDTQDPTVITSTVFLEQGKLLNIQGLSQEIGHMRGRRLATNLQVKLADVPSNVAAMPLTAVTTTLHQQKMCTVKTIGKVYDWIRTEGISGAYFVTPRRVRILLAKEFSWEFANALKKAFPAEVTDVLPDVRRQWSVPQNAQQQSQQRKSTEVIEITRVDFGPLLADALQVIARHFELKPLSLSGNVARALARDAFHAQRVHGTVVNRLYALRLSVWDAPQQHATTNQPNAANEQQYVSSLVAQGRYRAALMALRGRTNLRVLC